VVPATDVLDGGEGNDNLFGGQLRDTLDGGAGDDGLRAEEGDDTLTGGPGDDTLVGRAGTDALDAGAGADLLNGGAGNDSLSGGEGDDLLGIIVNEGSRPPEDRVSRDDGDDLVDGGPGDDLINGGPGTSVLNFGIDNQIGTSETTAPNGADDLRGGPGRDTITYENFAAPVKATLDGTPDDGAPGEGDNARPDVEVLVGGSAGDVLAGGAAGESIDGGAGNDSLTGGADDGGADSVNGGSGDDSVGGGPGDDSLTGAEGIDALDGGAGTDALDGGAGADDLAGGTGGDSLEGGPGDDRLRGAAETLAGADGPDSLSGGDGRDALDGGPGDDTLEGGRDADTVAGAAGTDIAIYKDLGLPVTATLDGAANDGTPGENDTLRPDVEGLRGGAEDDTFTGNAAANILDGGAGEDFLDGGKGSDELSGGEGIDLVRARDRGTDTVSCGPRLDLAITDRDDRLKGDCELDNASARPRPRAGRAVVVSRVRGVVGLRLPGGRRFFSFSERLLVPFGSALDAPRGQAGVRTAARRGKGRFGTFGGGRFAIRRRGALTVLALERQSPAACRRGGRRATLGRVRASLRSGFQVRGRRSVTSARRATVVVEDRCNGTLTKVKRGRATVVVLRGKRRIDVTVGRSYLARAG